MSNSHCVEIETTTMNNDIVIIRHVLAMLQPVTWHPESPMLSSMRPVLIQLVTSLLCWSWAIDVVGGSH